MKYKIVFVLKIMLVLFIASSMAFYVFFISAFDDFLLNKSYRPSMMYNVLVTTVTVGLLIYVVFFGKKILHKTVLLFITLMTYSFLTVTIYGSWETGYRNVMYPLISLKHIELDSDADFELSDCNVNYFFYIIENKHNKGILFRGITSLSPAPLCDRCPNSPSYTNCAESAYQEREK